MELKNKFDQIVNSSSEIEHRASRNERRVTYAYMSENSIESSGKYENANEFLGACFLKVNSDWAKEVNVEFKNSHEGIKLLISDSTKLVREIQKINDALSEITVKDGIINVKCENNQLSFTYMFTSLKRSSKKYLAVNLESLKVKLEKETNFESVKSIDLDPLYTRYLMSGVIALKESKDRVIRRGRLNEKTL